MNVHLEQLENTSWLTLTKMASLDQNVENYIDNFQCKCS
jgi:hypothetical protein